MKKLTEEQIKQIETLMDMTYQPLLGYFEERVKYHPNKLEVSEYGIKYWCEEYNDYCENGCSYEFALTLELPTLKQLLTIIGEII